MAAASDPSRPSEKPPPSALGLQIAGLAATNHLLTRLVPRIVPDPEGSRIPDDLALFGEAAVADLGEALVLLAVVPGVVEELIFRGLVFAIGHRVAGTPGAIVVSALAFGAAHLDLHLSTIAALLGLQLGCLRAVHGLLAAVLAHVTNNGLVLLLRYHDEAGLGWWPPLDEPGSASVVTLAVCLAVAGIAWAALRQAMRSPNGSSGGRAAGPEGTSEDSESGRMTST